MVHQGDEEPPQRCTPACCPSVSLPLPPASLLSIPSSRVLHALGKNALQRIPQEIRESFPSVVIPYRNCQVILFCSHEICRGNYSFLNFPLIRSMTWGTSFLEPVSKAWITSGFIELFKFCPHQRDMTQDLAHHENSFQAIPSLSLFSFHQKIIRLRLALNSHFIVLIFIIKMLL